MIVVLLHYTATIAEIDAQRADHLDWLHAGVESGILHLAGRQVPLTGGCFLCRGPREAIEAWAATDPFAVHGLAEYSFYEIAPSVVAPGLEALKG